MCEGSASATAKGVVATVVTYDRLHLLQQCLQAIHQQQPRPERIVVVDNGSTDGTADWLAEQRVHMPGLVVLRQRNCGPAGAYHTAFKAALDSGCDWIWSTDDDGIPQPGALGELLLQAGRHRLDMVGPMVLAEEDRSVLAFDRLGYTQAERFKALARDGVVPNSIALFNGTLLSRRVFDRIGNIKREMFIWGEEWEFALRARRAGFRDGIAVNALHVHPRNRRSSRPLFGGRFGSVEEMPTSREPFFFRNMGYIHATYERAAILRMMMKYTLYYLLERQGDVRALGRFYGAYLSGLCDHYPAKLRSQPEALPVPERMAGMAGS